MSIDLNEILEAVRSHGFWSEERSRFHDSHYKAYCARPERHSSDAAVCECNAESKVRYIGAVNAQRNALERIAAAVQREVDAEANTLRDLLADAYQRLAAYDLDLNPPRVEREVVVQTTSLNMPNLYLWGASTGHPRPVDILLDLESGQLWAQISDPEGIPRGVRQQTVIQWQIKPLIPAEMRELLHRIAPLAKTILNNSSIRWDGSDNVGIFDSLDAHDAKYQIEAMVAGAENDDWSVVNWVMADEFMFDSLEEIDARLANGDDIDFIYGEYQGDGSPDCPWIVELHDWLYQRQKAVRATATSK